MSRDPKGGSVDGSSIDRPNARATTDAHLGGSEPACEWCGDPARVSAAGRATRYCSIRCRKAMEVYRRDLPTHAERLAELERAARSYLNGAPHFIVNEIAEHRTWIARPASARGVPGQSGDPEPKHPASALGPSGNLGLRR